VQTLEHRIETVLAEIARWEYRDDMDRLRKGEVR
jgi:hypothetical protein